jgi:DNA-binding response OmpR family regulator
LVFETEKIPLTIKEVKLLQIFANNLNQIVDRNQLQKEVWEDEGIIVGRSLDVFISKIRKKLDMDPQVKLTNIHGKGYKLEV